MPGREDKPDRGGRVFVLLVVVLTAAYCLPVLLTDHLPIQDIPSHLAIVRTLVAAHSDPGWGQHFESRLRPGAYSTYYLVCTALAGWIGAEGANRLVLALYVVLLPLAFLCLVGAVDPARRWSVFPAFLLIYSDLYLVGFTNYLMALPALLAAVGLGLRIARGDRGLRPLVLGLGALAILLYLTHPFGLAMALVVLAVLTWSAAPKPRRVLWMAVGLLPGVVLLLHRLPTASVGAGSYRHLDLVFKLKYLVATPLIALDAHRSWAFYAAALLGAAFVVLALVELATGARARQRPRSTVRWWRDGPLLCFGLFLTGYLVAPFDAANATWFDLRLAVPAWLLLLLAMKPRFARGILQRGLLVALCAVSLLGVWSLHRGFDREIAPLFQVIDRMEPSARVLPILVDPFSRACRPFYSRDMILRYYSPYAHFESYYHVEKGGESPFMTFHPTLDWIPLGLKDPLYGQAFKVWEPFYPDRMLEKLPNVVAHFDYVLVRGLAPGAVQWIERFASPLARSGEFAVFDARRPPAAGEPRR
jgi:hypothetical protein